ncbi:hypothetical protein ScPMuIL_011039 [Solemya velum]
MASGIRQASQMKRNAFPGHLSKERWNGMNRDSVDQPTEQTVKRILNSNARLVDQFILECVDEQRILSLLEKKRNLNGNFEPVHKYKTLYEEYRGDSIADISRGLVQNTKDDSDILTHLVNMSQIVAQAIGVDYFALYIPINGGTMLASVQTETCVFTPYCSIEEGSTVPGHVATSREIVLVDNLASDKRFTNKTPEDDSRNKSVLCIPLILPTDELVAVMEFSRSGEGAVFTEIELHIANAYISWMSASLHQIEIIKGCTTVRVYNEFLLDTAKSMFEEVTDTDTLVRTIMGFTKNLVKADRCALFLVDEEADQLYAEYFDEGFHEKGVPIFSKLPKLRFPRDKGIAGYTAKTGEVVNISDAYSDPRFNHEIDMQTGYTTRNILCMPVINRRKIVGVVQMINSMSGDHFTEVDETAFKMFGVYCALALHYSQLYDTLDVKKAKHKVTLDVLQYHIPGNEEEFNKLIKKPFISEKALPADFHEYRFVCDGYENFLPHFFIYMLRDIAGDQYFIAPDKLCRFVVTVQKNYRPIEYHNWKHGFYVAHALWCMVKHNPGVLTRLEQMSLLVSGLCHDVDHRGYNNAFLKKLHLPLAALYSTSIMEQHHYRHTVTILQSVGHDIFSDLERNDYKSVLEMIHRNILATDLSLHFLNEKALEEDLRTGTVDFSNEDVRNKLIALMMVGADLNSCVKPWEPHRRQTDHVYLEFYSQGDEERRHGFEPDSIMDRFKKKERPSHQIAFLDFVCIPLYQTLNKLLPGTESMLSACQTNRVMWKKMADEQRGE